MKFGLFTSWSPWYVAGLDEGKPGELPTYLDPKFEMAAHEANFKEVDLAEEMGWDTVWLAASHLVYDLNWDPQPFVLAAALAGRTKRIKIGTAVHRPELRAPGEEMDEKQKSREGSAYTFKHIQPADPIQVAESIAMVDQLSRGRFIYGVGASTAGNDMRREHFFEYLDVLKQMMTETHFSGFKGKYYNYPPIQKQNVGIVPKPYQKPYPPILVPVDSQQSFVPMGTKGYRIAIGGGTSHNPRGESALKQDVDNYRKAWKEAGHPGTPATAVRIPTLVFPTRSEAIEMGERLMRVARTVFNRPDFRPIPGTANPATADHANLFGPPEEVVERIHILKEEFGADEIICEVNWISGVPRETIFRTMRLLTDKVIPKFK